MLPQAGYNNALLNVQLEFICAYQWRLWGVWLKTPSSSFAHWGRPSPRESASWTRQLTPRSAPNSSSTGLLSPCGGGMPSNGFTASQLSLPQRTALFNSSLFPLLYFLYCTSAALGSSPSATPTTGPILHATRQRRT